MNPNCSHIKCAAESAEMLMPEPNNPDECADSPDPATYWKKPPGIEFKTFLWTDPDSNLRGMLAADWIEYLARHARMICPFDPDNLKPASYELTLGPMYQIDGKEHILTDNNPTLIIPRNSIVFVSMREALVIPHYVAARFDLSIEYIYQGLLLGTGPQVDPGFQGVLSCPLHNISNNEIKMTLGKPFAKIDFEKTTWHESLSDGTRNWLETVNSEEDLYNQRSRLVGKDEKSLTLFRKEKRWRRPIIDYQSGKMNVISSVIEIDKKVDNALFKLDRITIGGLIAIVAFAATLVPIALQLYETYKSSIDSSIEQLRESDRALGGVENQYSSLIATQAAIEARLTVLEVAAPGSPNLDLGTPAASQQAAPSDAQTVQQ